MNNARAVEILSDLNENGLCRVGGSGGFVDELNDALALGIDALKSQEPKSLSFDWIDLRQSHPTSSQVCLVLVDWKRVYAELFTKEILIVYYDVERDMYCEPSKGLPACPAIIPTKAITHWLPIPKWPKLDKE